MRGDALRINSQKVTQAIQPKRPIKIALRELAEDEAEQVLKPWTGAAAFKATNIKLFGKGASASWTVQLVEAELSGL